MSSYEVWCHSCNVTVPPEQKRCLHCGARLHAERPGRAMRGREPAFVLTTGGFDEGRFDERRLEGGRFDERPPDRTVAPGNQAEAEGEEPVRRSLVRAGMTVVWMVLLAAGYAWRACSQQ
jgi:hypothetical protein